MAKNLKKLVASIIMAIAIPLLVGVPVNAAVSSSSASHMLKINIYDSTSLITVIENCDQIKTDQEKNNTYTEETFNQLMKACEEGKLILECLETASDASECADPGEGKEKIDDDINKLVPNKTTGSPGTGASSTWNVVAFGRNYAIPIVPFVLLSIATLISMGLVAFLVRRRIITKGISGIKMKKPWSDNTYESAYVSKLTKKHANDPLTKVVDVSEIVRKYRIKFVLWNTIPVLNIAIIFIVLILTTAPTTADSDFADINLTTKGDVSTTVINIDKASSGASVSAESNITTIDTDIHSGGTIDTVGGVFAKYSPQLVGEQTITQFESLLDNLVLTATQTTPGGSTLPSVELTQSSVATPLGPIIIPAEFDSTNLNGKKKFDHKLKLDLVNIADIPSGTYSIDIEYTLTVKEPAPPQEFTFTVDTTKRASFKVGGVWTGEPIDDTTYEIPICGNDPDPRPYDWLVYVDKYTYDNGNYSMVLVDTDNDAIGISETGLSYQEGDYYGVMCTGILITDLVPGVHTITIASNGPSLHGWARAFGSATFDEPNGTVTVVPGAVSITYLNTPLPLLGFMESESSAAHAFESVFKGVHELSIPMAVDTQYVNMAKITNFEEMFMKTHEHGSGIATTLDMSNIDTSGGVNFSNMFYGIHSHNALITTPIDISGLDTGNGVNFSGMLAYIHYNNNLVTTPIDISGLDTGNGVDFSHMFSWTHGWNTNLTSTIDISNLDVSGGEDFSNMFRGTYGGTNIEVGMDASSLDVGRGKNFAGMFLQTHYFNRNLTTPINVSGLNVSSGEDFSDMFYSTHSSNDELEIPIDISGLDFSSGIYFESMFALTYASDFNMTTPINVSGLDFSSGVSFVNMFYRAHANNDALISGVNASNMNTGNGIDFQLMFSETHAHNINLVTPINITGLDVSSGTNFDRMFSETHTYNTNLVTPIDISGLDVSSGTNFYGMFYHTHRENTSLSTAIDPSNMDVTSGTNFARMFAGTHYNNSNLANATLGNVRFHNSFKEKYDVWDKTNSQNNTFFQTFYLTSSDPLTATEPKYVDGSELSSVGSIGLTQTTWRPYYRRTGITPAPESSWR